MGAFSTSLLLLMVTLKVGNGQVGVCDYFFWIVPKTGYTPACNPVGRSSYVDCTALMYETQGNATRPSVEFYWSPNVEMVPSIWINITASPSKYSATEHYYTPSTLPRWVPTELSGIHGYERRLTISSTGTSDFGYYWCILEHPPGSSNIAIFDFSQSQALHLYQPTGVTTPCPSSRFDSTYWDILAAPECCEISIPTATPTDTPSMADTTTSVLTPGINQLCCTKEQWFRITASISIVIALSILIFLLVIFGNWVLIALERRSLRLAKRRADWRALGVTNEHDHHKSGLTGCEKCKRERQTRFLRTLTQMN